MRGLKLFGLSLLLCAGTANAQVSATVTAVSDYDFRGVSLSGTDPALQGSVDWAHDSGFYAGAWASSGLDFDSVCGDDGESPCESDYEIDVYVGFAGGDEEGLTYDGGIVYYTYWPDDDELDYPEAYFGLGYGMFGGKLWYTNDYNNGDIDAWYLEGNASIELPQGFTLNLHAGYNFGDYWKDVNGDETIDWSVGVGYTVAHFDLELKYVDNQTDVETEADAFNNEGRAILSVSTTFPWSNE